ncbi:WD domain, G-beta repeat [Musa troglodytarum]|uniref:WD domain, G-beta repeat n=1 Tax=Musa troglodytarum TaxID=320322 RepID=A0A9E7I339_9LILI|nr:WD domain, G-beta repeat [Musa troglodytarum]
MDSSSASPAAAASSPAFAFSSPPPVGDPRSPFSRPPSSISRPSYLVETPSRPRAPSSSSSRTIYSDRFIPSRSGSNFSLFDLSLPPSASSSSSSDAGREDGSGGYAQPCLGLSSLGRIRALRRRPRPTDRQLRLPGEALLPPHPPQQFEDELPGFSHIHPRAPRKVPRSPYKVLDAPALQDDFYLNLVDWSSHNVLAVGLGNCVYLWNACSSKVTKLCDLGVDDSVCSVGWAQRGNHLAVGTNQGKVQIWDASRCRRIRTMESHRLRVGALAWSSSLLSSGSRDKIILQRDIRAQEDFVSKLTGHKSEVCGLKWSHDNRELASGGNDNRLFVWNQHSTQPVLKYSEHTAAVKAIAWSPHVHGLLASGGGTADRCIRFWNTVTNSHLSCIDTGSQVCNLVWSKNVNELVSTHGYSQNQIIVWRYPTMSKLATLTGHTYRVLYLAISPDGQTIVTGAGDETLRFWNVFPSPKSQLRYSKP